jgi:hypothetical protein
MLPADELQLQKKNITPEKLAEQLKSFKTGFPWIKIASTAENGKGITAVSDIIEKNRLTSIWENTLQNNISVIKFVPASGAASRMFKDLFEFIDASYNEPKKTAEIKFFEKIENFAFHTDLNNMCLKTEGKSIQNLIADKQYKTIIKNLLLPRGLNYGNLPKGLLLFHKYQDENRTPLMEHLAEGALYAKADSNEVKIHFTVSTEHRILFEKHLNEVLTTFENKFGVKYNISFSEQKPSTDTVAADAENQPFRENGEMVFRPGGHGALIENLNDLNADIIFIKNIDNIVPDNFKEETIEYKKLIAGLLINIQKKCFKYLQSLDSKEISIDLINEIQQFIEKELCIINPRISELNNEELKHYLFAKLNRPIRVCGMVKNTGEPGGGPFLVENNDGTISLQILESSQINTSVAEEKEKMMRSTHFNPVDLVCAVKDYKGNKFDLTKYVDPQTGFISSKSKNGKELKALELPGLWNGAMSDWNTIFVEVPIETFNPVKTVIDLLRPEHQ